MRELAGGRLLGVDNNIATYLHDIHGHLTQASERITTLTELPTPPCPSPSRRPASSRT
jgi:magnesium transporter